MHLLSVELEEKKLDKNKIKKTGGILSLLLFGKGKNFSGNFLTLNIIKSFS
jgi:hypothetical protein